MALNVEVDEGATIVKPESSLPVEVTVDAGNDEVTHAPMSDVHSSAMTKYFSGLSNQLKGSVLCLVGILTLTPDTLLLRRLQFVPDFAVQFYRNVIFGITIFTFIALYSGKGTMKIFRDLGPFGWGAGMLWGASNMLFTSAIQLTAVANVLVIVASNTVFSSIFSYLLLGELIPIRMIVTSLICFGAIALIFSGSVGGGPGDSIGSILAVIAAITQGLFFSMIRYKFAKGQDVSNMDILSYNVVAAFFVSIVSLAFNPDLRKVHGVEIVYLLVDGIVVLAGGFGLLVLGPSYIPANEVSLFFLIETILGPVLVYLGGYESPPKFTLYGGICLIFALALNSVIAIREENRKKKPAALDVEEEDRGTENTLRVEEGRAASQSKDAVADIEEVKESNSF